MIEVPGILEPDLQHLISNFVSPYEPLALHIAWENLRNLGINCAPLDPKTFERPGFAVSRHTPTSLEKWAELINKIGKSFPGSEHLIDESYLLQYPQIPTVLVYPSAQQISFSVPDANFLTHAVAEGMSIWEYLRSSQK